MKLIQIVFLLVIKSKSIKYKIDFFVYTFVISLCNYLDRVTLV